MSSQLDTLHVYYCVTAIEVSDSALVRGKAAVVFFNGRFRWGSDRVDRQIGVASATVISFSYI